MGYLSTYELEWDPPSPTLDEVTMALAEIGQDGQEEWRQIVQGETEARWYENEREMADVSARFPGILFRLDSHGEDGERCRQYFRDGLVQNAQPALVYPDFNPELLKEPFRG